MYKIFRKQQNGNSKSYISIITLSVNGLNSPNKTLRVVEQIFKKLLYATYKRLTSALRIYTGSNWRDGKKDTLCKWNPKESKGSYIIKDKMHFKSSTVPKESSLVV